MHMHKARKPELKAEFRVVEPSLLTPESSRRTREIYYIVETKNLVVRDRKGFSGNGTGKESIYLSAPLS